MGMFVFAVLLGMIPAAIAHNKGHSFSLFWLYGTLLFIIALPHALLIKPVPEIVEAQALAAGGRKCQHCAEIIKAEAKVCRFCGRDV